MAICQDCSPAQNLVLGILLAEMMNLIAYVMLGMMNHLTCSAIPLAVDRDARNAADPVGDQILQFD